MTCLFYAALHYADAYFHQAGLLPGGRHHRIHSVREQYVVRALGRRLGADYTLLRLRSEVARYEGFTFGVSEVDELYSGPFSRIRTHVRVTLKL